MKNILTLLVILLVFTSCNETSKKVEKTDYNSNSPETSEATSSQSKNSSTLKSIFPGKSFVGIILESEPNKIIDSLGPANDGDAAMMKSVSTWNSNDDILTLYSTRGTETGDGYKIKSIRSTSANAKTEDKIGVNSSLEEIRKIFTLKKAGTFTEKGSDYTLYDTEKGISFEIGSDNICHGIVIHPKDVSATATYLPIYSDFKYVEN